MADFINANKLQNLGNISALLVDYRPFKWPISKAGSYPVSFAVTATIDDANPNTTNNYLIISENCKAWYDSADDFTEPINKQKLIDLAGIMRDDFVDWRSVSFDYVFNGIIGVLPSGLIDTIEFSYYEGNYTTRIFTYPMNYEYDNMCHYDWDNEPGEYGLRFMSPSAGIDAGGHEVCQTQILDEGGTWVNGITGVMYNPSPNNNFEPDTQGMFVIDPRGNAVIVEEDCPLSTATAGP